MYLIDAELNRAYSDYVRALNGKRDIETITRHAKTFNRLLKALGGPKINPTYQYLSMGF